MAAPGTSSGPVTLQIATESGPQTIEFATQPSDADIDEVARTFAKPAAPSPVGQPLAPVTQAKEDVIPNRQALIAERALLAQKAASQKSVIDRTETYQGPGYQTKNQAGLVVHSEGQDKQVLEQYQARIKAIDHILGRDAPFQGPPAPQAMNPPRQTDRAGHPGAPGHFATSGDREAMAMAAAGGDSEDVPYSSLIPQRKLTPPQQHKQAAQLQAQPEADGSLAGIMNLGMGALGDLNEKVLNFQASAPVLKYLPFFAAYNALPPAIRTNVAHVAPYLVPVAGQAAGLAQMGANAVAHPNETFTNMYESVHGANGPLDFVPQTIHDLNNPGIPDEQKVGGIINTAFALLAAVGVADRIGAPRPPGSGPGGGPPAAPADANAPKTPSPEAVEAFKQFLPAAEKSLSGMEPSAETAKAQAVIEAAKPHFRVTADGKVLPKETPAAITATPSTQEGAHVDTGPVSPTSPEISGSAPAPAPETVPPAAAAQQDPEQAVGGDAPPATTQTLGPSHTESVVAPPPLPDDAKISAPQSASAVTQGTNTATARERAAVGLGSLPAAESKSFGAIIDSAKAQGMDKPAVADAVAASVNAKPRPLTSEETGGLILRLAGLKQEHLAALNALEHAIDAGKMDQARTLGAQVEAIENAHDSITRALKSGGTETARALVARKLGINTDYDLTSVVQRAKAAAAGRGPLSADERIQFEQMAKQVKDLQDQMAEARTSRVNPSSPKTGGSQASKPLLDRVTSGNKIFTAEKVRASMRDLLGAPLGSGAEGTVKIGKALYNVAGAFVEAGYRSFPKFMAALRNAHPDVASKGTIEDWYDAHSKAKADIDKAMPVAAKGLPADQQAVIKELKAAQEERRKAIGDANAEDQLRSAAEKQAQVAKAADLARKDAAVLQARRQQAKEGFADGAAKERATGKMSKAISQAQTLADKVAQAKIEADRRAGIRKAQSMEKAAQRKARADYDREYRQRAGEAEAQQRENDTFADMNRSGADARDIEHKGAVERFVARQMDAGATAEGVMTAVRAKLPNADPYQVGQLVKNAASAYRARFAPGRSISEQYLERGNTALMGDDVARMRDHLDQVKRNIDAAVEGVRPKTWEERAANGITMGILSSTSFVGKMAGQAVGRVLTGPLEGLSSGLLDRIPTGGGKSLAELAPHERSSVGGMKAGAKAGAQEIKNALFHPDESVMRSALKGRPSRVEVSAGASPIQHGMPATNAASEAAGILANPTRLHAAAQAVPMVMDQAAAYENGIRQALKAGADVSDPLVQAKILEAASKVAQERALRNPTIFSHYSSAVEGMIRSSDPKARAAGVVLKAMGTAGNLTTSHLAKGIDYAGMAPLRAAIGVGKSFLTDGETGLARGLTDDQAASVARAVKRTPAALAIAALVMASPSWFKVAGLAKPAKGKGMQGSDGNQMKPGEIEIAGWKVPSWMARAIPQLAGATLMATAREAIAGRTSAGNATKGFVSQAPVVGPAGDVAEGNTRGLVQAAVPFSGALRMAAQYLDRDAKGNVVKRQESGPVQQVQAILPFLRNSLPIAKGVPASADLQWLKDKAAGANTHVPAPVEAEIKAYNSAISAYNGAKTDAAKAHAQASSASALQSIYKLATQYRQATEPAMKARPGDADTVKALFGASKRISVKKF